MAIVDRAPAQPVSLPTPARPLSARLDGALAFGTIVLLAILFSMPTIWLVLIAFKKESEWVSYPIQILPASPEVYYNRALAYRAGGKTGPALRDYDRALELSPGLAAAALNRGVLHYQEGRLRPARADLERALQAGATPAAAHYNLALVTVALGDDRAAREHLHRALNHDPEHTDARALCDRLP